jgi:hypothetical protein
MSRKRNRWKARTEGKKSPLMGLASKMRGGGEGAYYRESSGNAIFAVTAYLHYNLQPGHSYPFFVLESITAFYINFRNLRFTEQVWNFQLYMHHYFGSVIPLFMQKIFIVCVFLR